MSKLTTLDAVNLILRNLGENPLASLEIQYPTLDIAIPALNEATSEVLSEGWWFNTRYKITLVPDINGIVQVPQDTLAFYPEDESIAYDGTGLIYKDTGAPVLNVSVTGKLITFLEFETLPSNARYAIAYRAAYQVYVSDSGEDSTSQSINTRAGGYYLQLSAEHTRSQKFNSRKRRNVRRFLGNLRT